MATYCPEDGEDRELFSCPICFEDYDLIDARRAPKLLLCLHTFCYECTQKLWKNDGSIECSMCRMLHEKVCLEDLFDNHVIIQHLQREREERDLEFARKIDQELRSEFGGSPMTVEANNTVLEEDSERDGFSNTFEILNSTDENIEVDESVVVLQEENNSRLSIIDNDQEDDDEEEEADEDDVDADINERNDSQSHPFQGLLNSLNQDLSPVNDTEIEATGVLVSQVAPDDLHHDNSSDDSNEDSGNPSFCIENIQKLLDDDDEEEEEEIVENDVVQEDEDDDDDDGDGDDDDEEEDEDEDDGEEEEEEEEDDDEVEEDEQSEDVDTNVEINDSSTYMMENIQCLLGYTDNDDDDDDDERFHSACDDISTGFWAGDDDLAMQDGSEEDADTNTYCWQIVNKEPLMED